jgi:hypothetical protein
MSPLVGGTIRMATPNISGLEATRTYTLVSVALIKIVLKPL